MLQKNHAMPASDTSLELEFATDNALTGFRLERLEVLNWGTFDQRVWSLHPGGRNCLLTGDIGSGKSTLVDAITTLLVPANRVAYNKAAGAEFKERTLRSYVLGHYRSERNESTGTTRSVGLRDHNSYSVILGVFRNIGYGQTVSLAMFFWMKDPQGQPARFFVAAERDMSIPGDFANFGQDTGALRKKLRQSGAEVFDSYPPYGAWFRRRFGIGNEQALELFHQTVSMKSVGNLTDFVRNHMLEPSEVAPRIQALLAHFDDLNRAHEAVLKAKRQLGMLTPIVGDCKRHQEGTEAVRLLREQREMLRGHFAELKRSLLDKRMEHIASDLERQTRLIDKLAGELQDLRAEAESLRRNIAENGGDRLQRLASEILRREKEREERRRKADSYKARLQVLALRMPEDEESFITTQSRLKERRALAQEQESDLQNRLTEDSVQLRQGCGEQDTLQHELLSLKARRSNISSAQIDIRDELCKALGLAEDAMPFIGELLQVHENERLWEGAIERILHNFGLSLLVPDEHYAAVVDWVDRTHLRGRLVYYRVRARTAAERFELHRDSLIHKLSIKPDSPHYDWLERELAQRFDVACCANPEQFRREARAVTPAGQIKMPGERHEKDDRHRLDDRGRYVLGWSNAAKIAALEAQGRVLEKSLAAIAVRIAATQAEQKKLSEQLAALAGLAEYAEYREIDWQSPVREIEQLQAERKQLEASSNLLQQLAASLKTVEQRVRDTDTALSEKRKELGGIEARRDATQKSRSDTLEILNAQDADALESHREGLEQLRAGVLGGHQLTVESCDNRERDLREFLQADIDRKDKILSSLREKIARDMQAYAAAFPLETQEVDAGVGAAEEYLGMFHKLQSDDLPRFEAQFKELLNVNTIREIANFNTQLSRESEAIRERVERINTSLIEIDYNPGRFIRLEAQPSTDVEIREFRNELRACTENALTGSEDSQYSEAKFLQVRRIIERFRGREPQTELDKRWTQKVTDVRNWYTFAASERWREDNMEYEHYSDSGGKSGGQKEKLAYTILAASLAYQFGLEWGQVRSRSFRFVVIDEAFGRGSDESAQFGLQLFEKLNLQLLIVTPLQKIEIIEPYVASVGFVSNPEGKESKLQNLGIETFREQKERFQT